MSVRAAFAVTVLALTTVSCGGARHRHPTGPPPEYEPAPPADQARAAADGGEPKSPRASNGLLGERVVVGRDAGAD